MRRTIMGLAAILAVAIATPALANENSNNPSVSGFRVEGHGGWERVSIDTIGGKSGANYGVGLGYDFAITDSFFIGIDGSADESSTKACASGGGRTACLKTGPDLAAGAILIDRLFFSWLSWAYLLPCIALFLPPSANWYRSPDNAAT